MANPFPTIGFITQGQDFNYFQKSDVTWTSFGQYASVDGYGNSPDQIIYLSVPTQTVIMTNLSGTPSSNIVEYSFNGQTIHGELGSNTNNISLTFANRVISCIWFRMQTGGSAIVSVQAWSTR